MVGLWIMSELRLSCGTDWNCLPMGCSYDQSSQISQAGQTFRNGCRDHILTDCYCTLFCFWKKITASIQKNNRSQNIGTILRLLYKERCRIRYCKISPMKSFSHSWHTNFIGKMDMENKYSDVWKVKLLYDMLNPNSIPWCRCASKAIKAKKED